MKKKKMKVSYPINKVLDPDKFLGANNQFGRYPVGRFNSWHGGLHIEESRKEIKSIADGRIICFYYATENTPLFNSKDIKFSKTFVLAQHDYQSPLGNKFRFYSLYTHLLNGKDLTNFKLALPNFLSKKTYETKNNNLLKGVGIYNFTKTPKGKFVKGEEVSVIPKNTIVYLNDDKLTENTITYSFLNNKKVRKTSVYKKVNYLDLNGHSHDAFLNVSKNIAKKIGDTDSFKILYNKDSNSIIKGCFVYASNSTDSEIVKVLPVGKKVDVEVGKGKLFKLTDGSGYLKANDLKPINFFNESIDKNNIIACDIPVKANELIGYVGLNGMSLNNSYNASQIEVFSTENPKDFIKNTYKNDEGKKDGESEKRFAKIKVNTELHNQVILDLNLKKGAKVKVLGFKEDYFKVVELSKIQNTVKYSDLNDHYIGEKGFYTIKKERFNHVNSLFGNILKPNTKLYIFKEDGDNRTLYLKERTFWTHKKNLNTSCKEKEIQVKKTDEEIKILRNERLAKFENDIKSWKKTTNELLKKGATSVPKCPVHINITEEELTKKVKKTICDKKFDVNEIIKTCNFIKTAHLVYPELSPYKKEKLKQEVIVKLLSSKKQKDSDGKYWYYVTCNYYSSGIKLTQIGWVYENEIEIINAYDWTNFSFEIFDAGSDYIYSVKDYNEATQTSKFLTKVWNLIDTDNDKILTKQELNNAFSDLGIAKKMSRMICKHRSEWSYDHDSIVSEIEEFLENKAKSENKSIDEEQKQLAIEQIKFKLKELCFINETNRNLAVTDFSNEGKPKEEGNTTNKSKKPHITNYVLNEKGEKVLKYPEKKPKEITVPPRIFPESDIVWHFHPIAFVEQMKNICGEKEDIDLSDPSKWMSQFDHPIRPEKACHRTSIVVLNRYGVEGGHVGKKLSEKYANGTNKWSNVIQPVIQLSDKTLVNTGYEEASIKYLDSQLEKGNPIVVGLNKDKELKTYNKDDTTEHFVVITGRLTDQKGLYYRYFEVGTFAVNKNKKGVNPNNKLYLQSDFRLVGKKVLSTVTYTLTQVRKNI